MKEKVYAYLKTIPKGKVTTYGRIALYLGNKHLARTVGNILHQNPDPAQFPCHRVVNHAGRLAPGFHNQRMLLELEGVIIKENGCVDMARFRWEAE